jgi:hypothetical protein
MRAQGSFAMSSRLVSAALLSVLVLGCCRGKVGVTVTGSPSVDLASLSSMVLKVEGADGEDFSQVLYPPNGSFPDPATFVYKGNVDEGSWGITMLGYQGNQVVGVGTSSVLISGPCNWYSGPYSDVDVTTTITLTSDATH